MKKFTLRALSFALSVAPLALIAGSAGAVATPESPWDVAQRDNTATGYTKFIIENPDSPFTYEAAIRIATLFAGAAPLMIPQAESALSHDQIERSGDARLMNI